MVPMACLAALLLYGKALSDSEASEATLATPEEISARLVQARVRQEQERARQAEERAREQARQAEVRRAFLALTPAQHLVEAREALARGHDPTRGIGGDVAGAERHLAEIAPDAPEFSEASRLRGERARRQDALLVAGGALLRVQLRDADGQAGEDEDRRRARRIAIARALNGLTPYGMGCVFTSGNRDNSLRFGSGLCDDVMLAAVVPTDTRPAMRAAGFRWVRCRNGRANIDLEVGAP